MTIIYKGENAKPLDC